MLLPGNTPVEQLLTGVGVVEIVLESQCELLQRQRVGIAPDLCWPVAIVGDIEPAPRLGVAIVCDSIVANGAVMADLSGSVFPNRSS